MSNEIAPRFVANGEDVDLTQAPAYEKVGKIRAVCMDTPFVVVTLHGIQHAEEGDYLCEAILSDGSPGERWAVKANRFSATYRPVEGTGTGMQRVRDAIAHAKGEDAVPTAPIRWAREAPCEPGEFGGDPILTAADDEVQPHEVGV